MNKIKVLDDSLINKIAAGEVIERPASVVKELIENSLDAEATQIFINTLEGGKSLIEVADNGQGMSESDAKLCWQRHTTSKISSLNDLFSINTLGFRGEALASIAAVSEVKITTKTKSSDFGTEIVVKGGQFISMSSIGRDQGTTIAIKNLFMNTPVRKKYLDTIETELRYITDVVTKYALIHPEIHFKLIHHDKEIINSPECKDSLIKISYIYGSLVKDFIKIDRKNLIGIEGFISKSSISRSTKNDQSIYVNKRYVKNAKISSAVNDAYHTLMMVNRYPIVILNIIIDPAKTDVNVHPQKTEIRLREEHMIYQEVFDAIKDALSTELMIPEIKLTKKTLKKRYTIEPMQKLLVKEDTVTTTDILPEINVLGIIARTYIIAEIPDNILLIDQHAAAERILYEKYSKALADNNVSVQGLLEPVVLELNPRQYNLAKNNLEILAKLGYKTEDFGLNTVRVTTVPVYLGRQFNKDIFIDFVDELSLNKKPESLEKFIHNRIAKMSCRTAIKAGDIITLPQIKEYLKELLKSEIPPTCPHGRPILIKWSLYELEKMFKRIV